MPTEKFNNNQKYEELRAEFSLNLISSSIISYVGFAFAVMVFFEIPKTYIIGATFSSFFFVLSDFIYTIRPVNKPVKLFYASTIILGVFSFIVLPVILLNNEKLGLIFQEQGDKMTLFGLGLILILINLRILKGRANEAELYQELSESALKTAEMLEEVTRDYEESMTSRQDDLAKRLEIIEKDSRYLDERIEDAEMK